MKKEWNAPLLILLINNQALTNLENWLPRIYMIPQYTDDSCHNRFGMLDKSLLNGYEGGVQVKICSPSTVMVTST